VPLQNLEPDQFNGELKYSAKDERQHGGIVNQVVRGICRKSVQGSSCGFNEGHGLTHNADCRSACRASLLALAPGFC
jgi:hypothetical protein